MRTFRSVIRGLRFAPAFAVTIVLSAGIGIGVCTATFSILHGIAFPTVPYEAPERLVLLGATMNRQVGVATELLSSEQLQLWRDLPPSSFSITSAFSHHEALVAHTEPGTRRLSGAAVDGAFFQVLGVAPRMGRVIESADTRSGSVVVISETLWRTRFGSDPAAIGRTIRLGSHLHTIIGVMPRGFDYPRHALYWKSADASSLAETAGAYLLARLAGAVDFTTAEREVVMRYDNAWRTDSLRYAGMGVALERFGDRERRIGTGTMLMVAAGLALLFLTVLVNLSALVLARNTRRSAELAIRTALGATPLRAVTPFVAELLVLTGAAILVGLGITAVATPVARGLLPEYADTATPWVDLRVVAFAVLLAGFTTTVLALQPALRLRRLGALSTVVRQAGVATSTRGERRTYNALVAGQVALALVLVGAAGTVTRSLANLRSLDVGYDVERLVVASPEYDFHTWTDARQRQLGEAFLDRFAVRSDIESAAIWRFRMAAWPPPAQSELFAIEGREQEAFHPGMQLQSYYEVSDAFFRTLGVDVVAGRDFVRSDDAGSEPVAIIALSAARAWFGGEPAVGRRVRIGPSGGDWLRVVGVVPDLPRISPFGRIMATRQRADYLPWLYRPLAQAGDTPPENWPRRRCLDCAQVTMAVRMSEGGMDAHGLALGLAADLRSLAPELPVQPGPFLERQMSGHTPELLRRNRGILLGFAILAMGLASLGVFGVVADAVARRTREIGIRVALGARAGAVIRTVAQESITVAIAGAAAGVFVLATATGLTKHIFFAGGHESVLVGTSAADVRILVPAAVLIVLLSALTAICGAKRATRVDPNVALRMD